MGHSFGASIFQYSPPKSHHVLLFCTVISDPVIQGKTPDCGVPARIQVVLTD
jgi:hypothetical protein